MAITNRYSDQDLQDFKIRIEQKLEKANRDLEFMLDQIQNITEAMEDEGDPMEDTSNTNNLQMLYTMAGRQRHHIRDLENALLRIQSKSYGICMVTGELIDKRRLLAVPTTTKSLAAKLATVEELKEKVRSISMPRRTGSKISSKVISKPAIATAAKYAAPSEEEDFDDMDLLTGEDLRNSIMGLTDPLTDDQFDDEI